MFVAALGIAVCGAAFRVWPASASTVPVIAAVGAACFDSAVTTGCAPWVASDPWRQWLRKFAMMEATALVDLALLTGSSVLRSLCRM